MPVLLMMTVLAAAPQVAVLSVKDGVGALRFQRAGEALAPAVARVDLAPGSPLDGVLLPGRVVAAVGVQQPRGDLSFAGRLFKLVPGQPARVLCEGVVYGSRPVVSPEGRLFVARGEAGPQTEGALRVDTLHVDEVDPATGRTRTVVSTRGFMVVIAGVVGRELVVAELGPDGTRLLLVHADTLGQRELTRFQVTPYDAVVDAPRKRVLFTRDDADGFRVDAVSVTDGATATLAHGRELAMLPAVLADGRVVISAGPGAGLISPAGDTISPPNGSGFDRVRFSTAEAMVVMHETPSEAPRLLINRLPVATVPDAWLDVAGVLP